MPALLVAALGVAAVAGAALAHYEGLAALDRWCFSDSGRPKRRSVVAAVLALVALHVLQIVVFGLLFWWITQWPGGGRIDDAGDAGVLGAIYMSALNYSTLGLGGDPSPVGAIRMLVAIESLLGLLMITWSASFTYHRLSRRLAEGDSGGDADSR